MNLRTFLEQVTPAQGYLIAATPYEGIKGKSAPMKHFVSADIDAVITQMVEWNFDHKNVFFALAGYRAEKVWNATHKNKDGSLGKWQVRTHANAGWMRCLFVDLDVDAAPEGNKANTTFLSKDEACRELLRVVTKVGLPKPMVVDSGGGIHAYWPFDDDVTVEQWQPVANRFKAILAAEALKIDPAVPADSARVLRPAGCHNLKKATARPVVVLRAATPTPFDAFSTIFDLYEQHNGPVPMAPAKKNSAPPATGVSSLLAGGSLAVTRDPFDFGSAMFLCAAVGEQVATGGANASEPLWYAMLGLAKFALGDPTGAMKSVSHLHPDYDEQSMRAKADQWDFGPTTCARLATMCSSCQSCQFYGSITSPAQLGKYKEGRLDLKVELTDPTTGMVTAVPASTPPFPYLVRDNEVVRQEDMPDGTVDYPQVVPVAIYPRRIMRSVSHGVPTECSEWFVTQQQDDEIMLTIQHAWLADSRSMQNALSNAGVYLAGKQYDEVRNYMSAYLKKLAQDAKRERVFERLGWVGDNHSEGFVINNTLVAADGSLRACNTTKHVESCTKNGMRPTGTFAAWDDAMSFYAAPQYAGHRFFLYLALGAPLFHMTGYKGMIVNAVGASGRGKTTCLHACSSIWGHPESLIINGNPNGSTGNALGNLMGTFHSLPVLLDEITERDEFEMAEFFLNVSQGRGKERMKGNEHDGKVVTWETPVLTTANSDMIARVMATQKNASQHVMRAVGVDFSLIDTSPEAVRQANGFTRALKGNNGHAGIAFMRYVTQNYDQIKQLVEDGIDRIFADIGGRPEERYWIAAIVVAYLAGRIAQQLGFWAAFPLKDDLEWMKRHVGEMRSVVSGGVTTPVEAVCEFLNSHLPNTLVLSQKTASSVDNIAVRPRSDLAVRTELDIGVAYISKQALRTYCLREKINFREVESALTSMNVILNTNQLKTLGGGTPYATGQVRCWAVDIKALDPSYLTVVGNAITAQQAGRIAPLQQTGT